MILTGGSTLFSPGWNETEALKWKGSADCISVSLIRISSGKLRGRIRFEGSFQTLIPASNEPSRRSWLCAAAACQTVILRYVAAYIPSRLLAFPYVWFTGLREPLATTAYRDIWINFTCLFVLLRLIGTAVHVCRKKKGKKRKTKCKPVKLPFSFSMTDSL